jgi:hypothetical protein
MNGPNKKLIIVVLIFEIVMVCYVMGILAAKI